MKGNYLISICDILGFSNLVMNNELDIVLNSSLNNFKKRLQHSIHKEIFPEDDVKYKNIKVHPDLGIAWFSDTILIYSKKDDNDTCRKLLETVGWLIFENIFSANTRLRVGISYGEAFLDESEDIYIGKAIVEAYKLEQNQEWSGGALTKAAIERFGNYLASLNPMQSWVVPYNVPVKSSSFDKLLAINWTNGLHHIAKKDFKWSKEREEPSEEEIQKCPDIVRKWSNTRDFHNNNCWQCFPHLIPNGVIEPPGKFFL